jgi:hypothetical protein
VGGRDCNVQWSHDLMIPGPACECCSNHDRGAKCEVLSLDHNLASNLQRMQTQQGRDSHINRTAGRQC